MRDALFYNLTVMLPLVLSTLLIANSFATHPPIDDDKLAKKARKIHQRILTLDTHADAPINMQRPGFDVGVTHDTKKDQSQIDFPRMKAGGMDAMFFAVYTSQGPRTDAGHAEAKRNALNQFDLIHQALKNTQIWPNLRQHRLMPTEFRKQANERFLSVWRMATRWVTICRC